MVNEDTCLQADFSQWQAYRFPSSNDTLIRAREFLLNRLLGVTSSLAFNQDSAGDGSSSAADLAAEIKHALDDLKLSVMDESGADIDYAALRQSSAYAAYQRECLAMLAHFNPQELATDAARRAFWINLYNALVLDAVISFGVERSVTEGWLGIMAFFRRAAYIVNGARVSLEDIEHGILRGNQGHPYLPGAHFSSNDKRLAWALPLEPRIHFALNCASRSCPPIRAYAQERLDGQLGLAAKNFVDISTEFDAGKGILTLSRLFQWYAADFGGRQGVVDFMVAHLPDDHRREFLLASANEARLKFAPYDWHLNSF